MGRNDSVAINKLYEYIGIDCSDIDLDKAAGFLTLNEGQDGQDYWWYFDGKYNAACNIKTMEILEGEIVDSLFW